MVMALQARHWAWYSLWYGLAGMAWYMVWSSGHGVIYGMAWRPWHGICYGLAGIIWYGSADIAWYMVWPGEACHGMWKGIVLHVLSHCHVL